MTHKHSFLLAALAALTLSSAPLAPTPQGRETPKPAADVEITAALPQIPAAKFNLADYGAVGDGKTLNTDAFKKAVAAVEQAGGGRLIVPAGTYRTLPFTLASHMDLHLEPGSVIKAPETFEEYGIPDPNKAGPVAPGSGRGHLLA